jgi:mortality factor 4-like protein 1
MCIDSGVRTSSCLSDFLNSALGANLLYRFERAQYADIRHQFIESPDLSPEQLKSESQIYGAEHLVRLVGRCF